MTPLEKKQAIVKKWVDPVVRIESIFKVRRADGSLVPLKVPKSQYDILRKGILGSAKRLNRQGLTYRRVVNKGRQQGFSIILAAEAILIAEDYPNTFQYYIATKGDQAISWLSKVEQLCLDANHWSDELGGGPILNINSLTNKTKKIINNCTLVGFAANPAGLRGDTGINGIMDEAAWMILRKNQQEETYTAMKYFFRQGGQITVQSTPRVSNDQFWNFYEHSEKHGFEPFYKPTIENWSELDLDSPLFIDLNNERRRLSGLPSVSDEEKEKLKRKYLIRDVYWYNEKNKSIEQKAKIPYWWIKLQDLEKDRYSDIEIFKQENLGIPVDERYKLIKGSWIYENIIDEETDWEDRGDSLNPFYFGIDFAQKRDLTICMIIEKIGNDFFVRRAEIISGKYPAQAARINQLINLFNPLKVKADNTGVGIAVCDILEKIMKNKHSLERVNFTNDSKKNMAENFKSICQSDNFHMLNYTKDHNTVIKHILKVEKDVGETAIRYSGKNVDQEGRDDGFWASALSVFEKPTDKPKQVNVKAGFGRLHRVEQTNKMSRKEQLFNELHKEKKTVNQINELKEISIVENIMICINELKKGILICPEVNKPIKPIRCIICPVQTCNYYKVHKQILNSYKLKQEQIMEGLDNEIKNKIIKFHEKIREKKE